MTLHDLFTLLILPIGTLGIIKYNIWNIQVNTFWSYKYINIKEQKQNYATHDLDLAIIVHVLKIWRHYLTGKKFELRTDHHGLIYLFEQPKKMQDKEPLGARNLKSMWLGPYIMSKALKNRCTSIIIRCWCICNFGIYSLVYIMYCTLMFILGSIYNLIESFHASMLRSGDSII